MMGKLKHTKLTQHEWFDALKVPEPYRSKKKYFRKEKHKKNIKIVVINLSLDVDLIIENL